MTESELALIRATIMQQIAETARLSTRDRHSEFKSFWYSVVISMGLIIASALFTYLLIKLL